MMKLLRSKVKVYYQSKPLMFKDKEITTRVCITRDRTHNKEKENLNNPNKGKT